MKLNCRETAKVPPSGSGSALLSASRGKCLIADLWQKSPQRAIKQHFGSFLRGQVLLISLKSGRQMEMTCLVD